MTEYNPRYVAYAHSKDMNVEECLEHERKAWPGGIMCGFTLWIREHARKFAKDIYGITDPNDICYATSNTAEFTEYLEKQAHEQRTGRRR